VPEPVSIMVRTDGTGRVPEARLQEIVRRHFDFRPRAIIEYLDLRRPIFRKTAAFGHFGRLDPDFTWERTNRVKDLQNDA
jgi:S-adenosylmethionine synthetase